MRARAWLAVLVVVALLAVDLRGAVPFKWWQIDGTQSARLFYPRDDTSHIGAQDSLWPAIWVRVLNAETLLVSYLEADTVVVDTLSGRVADLDSVLTRLLRARYAAIDTGMIDTLITILLDYDIATGDSLRARVISADSVLALLLVGDLRGTADSAAACDTCRAAAWAMEATHADSADRADSTRAAAWAALADLADSALAALWAATSTVSDSANSAHWSAEADSATRADSARAALEASVAPAVRVTTLELVGNSTMTREYNAGALRIGSSVAGGLDYVWADISTTVGGGSTLDSAFCYYTITDARDSVKVEITRRPFSGGTLQVRGSSGWTKAVVTGGRIECACTVPTVPSDSVTVVLVSIGKRVNPYILHVGVKSHDRRL